MEEGSAMQQHIGTTLGAYQIVEQIGRGGMATVFKAYQPSMDRYVAVKILPSHFTEDSSFMGRFTQEARTLARLEHPHILPVHDYGEQQGITYLVMRYVEAGTLKDVITQTGPMTLPEAARIMGQVGGAVDYAHSQGVVHRDIKPSNVLIDRRGNTFLTDFGIARLVAETAQFTATGAIIGTPAYMSPEQGLGQPADHRSDIYALGVVLFEMLTGHVPYEAETPLAVLLKHVNEPLPLPRQIKPDLPPAIERVLLKALAKDPDHRFQSAQALVDALQEAVGLGPAETLVRSQPAVTPAPAARPAPEPRPRPKAALAEPRPRAEASARSRKRWPLYAGAALLAVALVVAAVLLIPNLLDGQPEPAAVSTQPAVSTLVVTPEATSALEVVVTSTPIPQPAVQVPSGWTNYGNANFVSALARHEDILWVGSESGLVRWNLADGHYTRFGLVDGLASEYITDLLVDDAGVLWVATDAGVGRFDGESWITYDVADGLDANWITVLFQDEFGGLWAGSRGGERGLNHLEGARWGAPSPLFFPQLPVEYPNLTVMGGNEDVGYFVGLEDEGLLLFEGESWLLLTEADGLPAGGVLDGLLTGDSLWVSYEEAVLRIDLESGDWETLPLEYVHTIHETADGELWFGGAWRAIWYDPYTGDYEEVETDTGPIPGWLVTDIAEDENRLWFGTYGGGVAAYDGARWEVWATEQELAGSLVVAIRQDQDGDIWVTHDGSGLSRYRPADDSWQVFDESGGALDWPSDPGIDSRGNLWIGDYGELVYYDGQTWNTFSAPELADVSIYAIEIGPGDVQWLATDSGLMRYDPATGQWATFTAADHPILADVWTFLATSDGLFWAAGAEGIIQYDGQTWSAPQASGSPPEWVDDLAEAPDGSLWLAADGELVHLTAGRWSYHEWPSDGWLESLAVAPDGSVWAGYDGLGRYDPATGNWQLFTTADGLGHMLVQDIHVTPEGVVWVGTLSGVSRYVPPR
jgi:ligand-binding sensor domain-containing protein